MSVEIGTNINQYKIISPIGRGGMGEVFLAQDTKLDRKVALKILPKEFAEDKDRMGRFVREAKSASALNHPNIITIHEIGESDGTHFIATEFIDGKTLNDYSQTNSLDYRSALDIAIQVASALDEAHSAGIVHRDIKPDNVMVRANGLVKILDFGIAKVISDSGFGIADLKTPNKEGETLLQPSGNPKSQSTIPGMIIGTANYMSPEQAEGKEVDARTDVFSFGVVLYEMITGGLPFEGDSAMKMIGAILHKEPKPLSSDIPAEIAKIIGKCLRKDRYDRYQTIRDVLIDLKDVKQDLEFQHKLERNVSPERADHETQILKTTTADKVDQTTTNQTVSEGPKTKYLAAGLLALLLAMGGFLGYRYLAPPTSKQIESIAVLPFVNASGNADVEYLSDGMTETLITSLSQLPNLNVKPRSSVFQYKGKNANPLTIAKELNVQAVLNGRVVQRGQDISLFVELIDVALDKVVWSQQYNRKQSDLATLQSDIARDVSSKLKSKLSGAEIAKVQKNSDVDPEVYQLYLKGLFQFNRKTSESMKLAEELFKQAIDKDPNYAPAHSALARTVATSLLWSVSSPKEAYPIARASALRALELDESLAEAHVVLGSYFSDYDWDYSSAEREYRRAIELEPNNPYARLALASLLTIYRRFDEAVSEGRKTVELDPLSKRSGLVNPLMAAGRFDEAIAELKPLIPLDPNYSETYYYLGVAYYGKGAYRESASAFERYLELDEDPITRALFAQAQSKTGNREEAVKQLNWLQQESSKRYVPGYSFAVVNIALGRKDEALTWLEKDVEARSIMATGYPTDPFLADVRNEPRFKALLKRMNTPE